MSTLRLSIPMSLLSLEATSFDIMVICSEFIRYKRLQHSVDVDIVHKYIAQIALTSGRYYGKMHYVTIAQLNTKAKRNKRHKMEDTKHSK